MKKLIYLIMVIGLFFTACDPMDEIYTTIDAQQTVIVGDATYTLTNDDYSALDLGYGNFSSENDAKTALPSFLTNMYPVWGKGSSVLVGYQLYVGSAQGVSDYTQADKYYLANMDYPRGSDNAVAFFPEENPADLLADILNVNMGTPSDGDIVLAKYKQYTGVPTFGISNYFEEGYNGSLGSWESINVSGANTWKSSSYNSDEYAKASGYIWPNALASEDWLISPEIDLTDQTNATLEIRQAINHGSTDLLDVLISTDYTTGGDYSTATWDELNLQNTPDGTNWTFLVTDPYNLTAYEGETIHIALRYVSTDGDAATWEVDNVVVKVPGIEGNTKKAETFYTYSGGNWVKSKGVYFVQDTDFDSMGEGSGQPGKYNNFGSSTPPDDYLPTFLSLKFPYALEETELFVIYDYYSSKSGAQIRGNLYTVINGAWVGYKSTISTTLQFGHDGATWVPDNTIKYILTGADYAYMAAQLTGNADFDNVSLPNLSSYGDFDYNWTDAQIIQALGILADHINPTAEEGQKYTFTYLLYDNGLNTLGISIILTNGVWVLNN